MTVTLPDVEGHVSVAHEHAPAVPARVDSRRVKWAALEAALGRQLCLQGLEKARDIGVKPAAFGAASSSTRGSGWAPSGAASPLGVPTPPHSRKARPEEPQAPSWGTMLPRGPEEAQKPSWGTMLPRGPEQAQEPGWGALTAKGP